VGTTTIVCVANSTGHGVPGAFLATLWLNTLGTIIEEQQITSPAQILKQVNELLVRHLQKTGEETDQADGIEMTIISIDSINQKALFAGACGYI